MSSKDIQGLIENMQLDLVIMQCVRFLRVNECTNSQVLCYVVTSPTVTPETNDRMCVCVCKKKRLQ